MVKHFFGIIAIVMGWISIDDNSANKILFALGILLFAEGVFLRLFKHQVGLIVDGLAVISLSVWNFIVALINYDNYSGLGFRFWVTLSMSQLVFGIQSIRRYRRYANITKIQPDEELSKWVYDEIDNFKSIDIEKNYRAISLSAAGHTGQTSWFIKLLGQKLWLGILQQGGAIFKNMNGPELIIVPAEKVKLKIKKERENQSKAQLIIDGKIICTGIIPKNQVKRYEIWKQRSSSGIKDIHDAKRTSTIWRKWPIAAVLAAISWIIFAYWLGWAMFESHSPVLEIMRLSVTIAPLIILIRTIYHSEKKWPSTLIIAGSLLDIAFRVSLFLLTVGKSMLNIKSIVNLFFIGSNIGLNLMIFGIYTLLFKIIYEDKYPDSPCKPGNIYIIVPGLLLFSMLLVASYLIFNNDSNIIALVLFLITDSLLYSLLFSLSLLRSIKNKSRLSWIQTTSILMMLITIILSNINSIVGFTDIKNIFPILHQLPLSILAVAYFADND